MRDLQQKDSVSHESRSSVKATELYRYRSRFRAVQSKNLPYIKNFLQGLSLPDRFL